MNVFPIPIAAAALVLGTVAATPARADTQPPWPGGTDPVLDALVSDALQNRPEVKQAAATARGEQERVPQAGALPDPMLLLGIQNDGFKEINIGKMETSFWQVGVSQGFFWPGKRDLRGRVASDAVRQANAATARTRLTTEAEVRRAYVDLLLVRDQLALLAKLETLWEESERLAKTRYEVGQGPQSDLFRAQLERTRLRQQRLVLEAGERTRLQTLNRLRVHPLDEPIETPRRLADLPDPVLPPVTDAIADAEGRSPDLLQARAASDQSARTVDLARRERFPDFTVNAAYMGRGQLEPMWALGLSVSLPVWSGSKQNRAVSESVERRAAAGEAEEAVRQLLRLRTQERLALLDSALRENQLYRGGLLVQSESTASSTLAQYQVGRVPFAAVLEALGGLISDHGGFLDTTAQAQRLAIAQAELSLDAPPGAEGAMGGGGGAGGGMGAAAAGGAGGMGGKGGGKGGGMSLPGMSLGAGASGGAASPAGPSKGGGM